MKIYRKVMVADRLPKESGYYLTNSGMRYFIESFKNLNITPQYWLEEIELPTDEEIEKESYLPFTKDDKEGQYGEFVEDDSNRFLLGANYILNKIKND